MCAYRLPDSTLGLLSNHLGCIPTNTLVEAEQERPIFVVRKPLSDFRTQCPRFIFGIFLHAENEGQRAILTRAFRILFPLSQNPLEQRSLVIRRFPASLNLPCSWLVQFKRKG